MTPTRIVLAMLALTLLAAPGFAAAFTLPPDEPKMWVVPGLMLVALGVALALASKLYATIWDLRRAVSRREQGGR